LAGFCAFDRPFTSPLPADGRARGDLRRRRLEQDVQGRAGLGASRQRPLEGRTVRAAESARSTSPSLAPDRRIRGITYMSAALALPGCTQARSESERIERRTLRGVHASSMRPHIVAQITSWRFPARRLTSNGYGLRSQRRARRRPLSVFGGV
jgi:hypothetical protein